jgi:RNA polymerase sigma-70 factor, ECF subfamily
MSNSTRERLRRLFLLDYEALKTHLTRYLGSADRASDALQDTWLRLERVAAIGPVNRPYPYLLRIAYNIGLKRREGERRTVALAEARAALDLVDDAPDPARIAEGRSEVAALEQALAELTPRRREILLASRVDGIPLREIAVRQDISQRLVEMELKLALIHCGRRLGRRITQRFGPRASRGSEKQGSYDAESDAVVRPDDNEWR